MNKFLVLIIFLFTACGYQPLYKSNKEVNSFKIQKVEFIGNNEIGKKIYANLPFILLKDDKSLNKINIYSNKSVVEASKSSKGQVTSYRTTLTIKFEIINNNGEIIDKKIIKKDFSYNTDENKFKFKEYQNKIEENLIEDIVEDIIFYINYS